MKKKFKKGFTIVELVIVIAVIGILAAVLIPMFSGLINKAYLAADESMVRNINNQLAIAEVQVGKNPTMHEALLDAQEAGYIVANINAKSKGNLLVWDQTLDRVALIEKETGKVIAGQVADINNKVSLWQTAESYTAGGYSIYLKNGYNGSADISGVNTGIDVGNNENISSISYVNSSSQSVVIRTNGGTLTVNAVSDTVKHYGDAQVVTLTAVGDHSYYEHGSVDLVDIKKGRLVITSDSEAEVGTIYLTATGDGYDGIILAKESGSELPEVVARESVTLPTGSNKKLVVTIQQVDSNGTADSSKTEEIYLYPASDVKEADKGYNVSDLGLLVVEALSESGRAEAAQQISDPEVLANVEEAKTQDLEDVTAAAVKFAGGKGTEEKPYLISNADHWNNFYQIIYEFNLEDKVPHFKLINDIELAGVDINNYAINSAGDKVTGYYMSFVLDGNNFAIKGIEKLKGYCQLLPYPKNATVKNITIDYNLKDTRTAAMSYSTYGDVYFVNVITTGQIKTSANWASAFVAYPQASNVYYTNCTNRANLTTNFTSNSYVAPFGSHNGANGAHIYFDNCQNFGNIAGGHVGGFVGMGNNDHFNFKDENAVKNYGSLTYSSDYGYFQYGKTQDTFKTNNTNVTCTVKQSGSSNQKLATLSVNNPTNGEKLVINNIDGATRYEVTVSASIQVYNYDDGANANKWSGGFPRSMTGEYVAENGETTETAFINVALKENRGTRLNYQTDEEVAYNGLFVDEEFDINSSDVTILLGNPETDPFVLVSYKNEIFYYFMNGEYYGLISDGATKITLTFSVTAYNGDVVLGALSSYSYSYTL